MLKLEINEKAAKDQPVTDDQNRIQAEVEQRLSQLEPEVEVLAVELIGGRRSPVLRIYLDREGGVDLELCARVTRHLRDLLREYTVEVSSPGPERPLTKLEHYRRFMGRRVRVRTREAIEGRSDFKGELIGADDRGVALAGEWGTVTIPHERIRRSNLVQQTPAGKTGRQK
jgi:ribosome maturation factor RimP